MVLRREREGFLALSGDQHLKADAFEHLPHEAAKDVLVLDRSDFGQNGSKICESVTSSIPSPASCTVRVT